MHRDRGFTLLEVLVAFIIAAFALAALFSGGLGGLRATVISARYGEAVSRAKSHLAAAAIDTSITPGDRQGDEGNGFHWRVRITVLATGTLDPLALRTPVLALYAVSSAVSWTEDGHTRAVQLDTQKAATAPLPRP
jgi:general secretion pathway protein I